MTSIISNNAAAGNLPTLALEPSPGPSLKGRGNESALRGKFTEFVGQAFFGQMLKSMRATVGKPAYFHGGRAEEVFQSQLDQTMSEHLTEASASKIAEPMFARHFPKFAEAKPVSGLGELSQLRRQ
jgi:peptidoglycan hydrolase FlgJ